ncbi:helix-loop-helix protein delilah-like [Agrilus planipennis]|uniref:Helix-loop-helix protein delilah-like n=1 Tax=Agrilus planipennis TaxID=224129 RepID=A0A1W4W6M8_AGRPL|nr:helix-loop-helix protein delilah-like [Agrilus planipennis]
MSTMDSLLQYDAELTQRLSHPLEDMAYPDANNNEGCDPTTTSSPKEDKYSLRPRSVRRVTESLRKQQSSETDSTKPTKPAKPKQKPAPLSKYRRKTANARERSRMREINQAFETLRRAVPQTLSQTHVGNNEKLTKITTLKLAMKYISTLSATLNSAEATLPDFGSDYSDLDYLLLESDGESLPLSDNSLLASPDFPEPSLSPVDFDDPSLPVLLQTDFSDHGLEPTDFSDFLLT